MTKLAQQMKGYGQHVLISAIKYLDGTPQGSEGMYTAQERRAAIYIMLAKLPKFTRQLLEKERADFWSVR